MSEKGFLTTGEAAEALGMTQQGVISLCERGKLQFGCVGKNRMRLILAEDVERMRREREAKSVKPSRDGQPVLP